MPDVKVHVPIRIGDSPSVEIYLFETTFTMDFLPMPGEVIHPLKNDPDSSLSFEIASRYWDTKGNVVLKIDQYIIDPDDSLFPLPSKWHSWWTDWDGDLIAMLLANGWWH